MEVSWRLPLGNSLNLLGVHTQAFMGDQEAKKAHSVLAKLTLGGLDLEASSIQGVQHKTYMLHMLLSRFAEDAAIVKENHHKLVQVRLQDIVHQLHKSRRGASETKGEDFKGIETIPSPEGSSILTVRVYLHLVITTPEVQGSEELGTMKSVQQLIDAGKRVFVRDSERVELPVVNTHPETSIFLANKEDGSTKLSLRGTDPATFQVYLQLTLNLFQLCRRHPVGTLGRWFGIWPETNLEGRVSRFRHTSRFIKVVTTLLKHAGVGLCYSRRQVSGWKQGVRGRRRWSCGGGICGERGNGSSGSSERGESGGERGRRVMGIRRLGVREGLELLQGGQEAELLARWVTVQFP
jgi:hypothetical protein